MSKEDDDQSLEKLYAKIDIHNTGKVDLPTLIKAFEITDHPLKNSHNAIATLFKSLDSNQDDVIDFNEFKEYIQKAETQIKEGFRKLDADKDGKIITSEMKKYLQIGDKDLDDFKHFSKFLKTKNSEYITYDNWREFLLFVPRINGSRLRTAYEFLNNNEADLNSEGDVTVVNEFLKGVGFFLAGGLSGVVSRTCTAPFDRIKVFLIARTDLSSTLLHKKAELAQQHGKVPLEKIRSPIIKAATTLYRQGGLRAFYVGNGLNVMKVFPESAMKFGTFELMKRTLAKIEGVDDSSKLSKLSTYFAGGMGGVVSQFSVYPIDTLKYRVQCAQLDANLRGNQLLIATAKQMYKEGGLKLFYRGVFVGVAGIFPYAALDLGTFSAMKKWMINREAKKTGCSPDDVVLSNLIVLPMGAFSGSVGATVVYPINLLRTRLQAQGTYAHPHTYDGFRDVLVKTVQKEGYYGLFKGLVPNLAKVAPAVSLSYLMYENLKRLMGLE
ncbi:CYFA0S10e01486g1_1 [Cyberlindnera fabianii]|uniref:CYFA0S10e01486g1_1 n=1 Tax=Cyberlindnera fabianii TaxID=36022 RepID=A0A061AYH9_CYBFA|nr:Calcium-binding mitochondrial carrier SAL1 [Cyberlindnera fabianii]CDR42718.1 CYFA0S10e01486g1_1 [Cyberlindnera fabianii]